MSRKIVYIVFLTLILTGITIALVFGADKRDHCDYNLTGPCILAKPTNGFLNSEDPAKFLIIIPGIS